MRVRKIYQTLSKRAKELLARDEGVDVDWKQTDKFDSIESYTSESGDSIISKVEILENELGEVSKTTGIAKLAVDELLKKQGRGLDDSVTIYWRRIIHQSIGMFNESTKRFQKDGREEMPFEEYYEHMLAVCPKLDRAFLLSLINEKLPDFKPATKKRKSI
jgi:hypothetical protein